jgi:hypothetical protein
MEDITTVVLYGVEGQLDANDYLPGNALVVWVTDELTRHTEYNSTYAVRDLCTRKDQLFTVDIGSDFRAIDVKKMLIKENLSSMVILVTDMVDPKVAQGIVNRLVTLHRQYREQAIETQHERPSLLVA